jgi:DNA-binding IclR family transcriptional regulator
MPFSREHSAKPTSVGREHWMFESAVGAAYLSRCGAAQLKACHSAAVEHHLRDGNARPVPSIEALMANAENIRTAGYALRLAKPTDVNSAIAVPVHTGDWAIGAIACSTFPRSLSPNFIQKVLPGLTEAARHIAEACAETRT